MKRCRDCGQNKPLSEFYRSQQRRDGYRNECKPCWLVTNGQQRRQRLTDPEYRKRRRAQQRAAYRRARAVNPEPWRARDQRRRAREYAVEHESYNFHAICEVAGWLCYLCGGEFFELVRDHVIPISRGGPDAGWNIAPACAPCNSRKGSKLLSELDWSPALPPADIRLWVRLAASERWGEQAV